MLPRRSMKSWLMLVAASLFSAVAGAQTLNIGNGIHTHNALTNTTVTMTGHCELRLTAASNPMPGCVIHLNSPDAWLLLPNIRPSAAASLLGLIRVNGAGAVSGGNIRVDEFAMGSVLVPHGPAFRPLRVFSERNFLGSSAANFALYTYYTNAGLGAFDRAIRSFKLKRGYMATFAQRDDGGGASEVFVAQDGDLEVGVLATNLDRSVRFVRVLPWRWTSKKGWAGGVQPLVRPHWNYDWDNVATSTVDAEYVPMRHNANWNAYANINNKQRSAHALGFNEPDQANQADMSVASAVAQWPNLVRSGLRVGAPAVSDSGISGQGLSWLYAFMDEIDALGYRVDFVPVHFYKCDWSASAYYNWLLGIYQTTGRPLWVTEFNNGANWCAGTPPTLAQNATRITEFLEMLEGAPFVERYAIYNWVGAERAMVADNGTLPPPPRLLHLPPSFRPHRLRRLLRLPQALLRPLRAQPLQPQGPHNLHPPLPYSHPFSSLCLRRPLLRQHFRARAFRCIDRLSLDSERLDRPRLRPLQRDAQPPPQPRNSDSLRQHSRRNQHRLVEVEPQRPPHCMQQPRL